MYLAGEIDYTIKYVEKIKELQSAENANTNSIPAFDVDESTVFGSEDIQEFTNGGLAYKV